MTALYGFSYLEPLGHWDGALVWVLGEERLLVLEPAWPAKEIEVDLGKYRLADDRRRNPSRQLDRGKKNKR